MSLSLINLLALFAMQTQPMCQQDQEADIKVTTCLKTNSQQVAEAIEWKYENTSTFNVEIAQFYCDKNVFGVLLSGARGSLGVDVGSQASHTMSTCSIKAGKYILLRPGQTHTRKTHLNSLGFKIRPEAAYWLDASNVIELRTHSGSVKEVFANSGAQFAPVRMQESQPFPKAKAISNQITLSCKQVNQQKIAGDLPIEFCLDHSNRMHFTIQNSSKRALHVQCPSSKSNFSMARFQGTNVEFFNVDRSAPPDFMIIEPGKQYTQASDIIGHMAKTSLKGTVKLSFQLRCEFRYWDELDNVFYGVKRFEFDNVQLD